MFRLTLTFAAFCLLHFPAAAIACAEPGKDALEAEAQWKQADQLVEEAAHREWYALEQERKRLLDRAIELALTIRWRTGTADSFACPGLGSRLTTPFRCSPTIRAWRLTRNCVIDHPTPSPGIGGWPPGLAPTAWS